MYSLHPAAFTDEYWEAVRAYGKTVDGTRLQGEDMLGVGHEWHRLFGFVDQAAGVCRMRATSTRMDFVGKGASRYDVRRVWYLRTNTRPDA